jgi:transposase
MVGSKSMNKSERIERILEESLAPMSKRQIAKALPDVSIHTIDAVVKRLVSEGRVEKIGDYKVARYRMKD